MGKEDIIIGDVKPAGILAGVQAGIVNRLEWLEGEVKLLKQSAKVWGGLVKRVDELEARLNNKPECMNRCSDKPYSDEYVRARLKEALDYLEGE